jgi:hypothetical protein
MPWTPGSLTKISSRPMANKRAITKQTDSHIAVGAQQSTDTFGFMAVINVKRFVRDFIANRAFALLRTLHLCIFRFGKAVWSKSGFSPELSRSDGIIFHSFSGTNACLLLARTAIKRNSERPMSILRKSRDRQEFLAFQAKSFGRKLDRLVIFLPFNNVPAVGRRSARFASYGDAIRSLCVFIELIKRFVFLARAALSQISLPVHGDIYAMDS